MEEHSRYVAQLKAEFDSCDTTETGFLDRDELTELCSRLQLDTHLDLLLDTLLGRHSRVNFEEFKDVFVSVLSRSLDFSTSEDDSSYLEPVVPEEVKPKFVKGTKRYGRRSRPDSTPGAALTCDSEDSPPSRTEASDSSPVGVRRAKLRRATSLESVESLKSDEEAGSQKNIQTHFQSEAHQQEEEELGVGGGPHVLTAVCHHLGLQRLHTEEVDVLLRKLDADLDGRVSITEFKKVLCGSAPMTCSTPVRSADLQRAPHGSQTVLEEPGLSARSTSSLLSATVGQKVLSRLDDGSGSTSPNQVIALWTEEGIRNSRDILQTLDFPLEERLSLTDLTLALDNELLVSGNSIHQVALISYKNEIQHLQEAADQACRERDKVKADLEMADQRNLQLVREVDDRHASMETLNQTRIRDLEQDFRDRLTVLRSQSEQESEALLQQADRERSAMQEELQLLRAQEAELQEELNGGRQENLRLDQELNSVKLQLNKAQSSVSKLQRDLDQLLHDKFGSLDPSGAGPSHEERFSEIVREYELQCRELQDRNDELSSEVELLNSQRRNRRSAGDDGNTTLSWRQQHSESDDSNMKRSSSPSTRKKLQPADKTALCSLDDVSGSAVSIQTELALEQLKQKHEQEMQQLNIQLETQVNYYKRSLDLMRQSMEVERKDISQAFKLEISELEEQKSETEQQVKQLKEALDNLQTQIQHGGGGWSSEQQRRMQWERAELEQNFAREIGNLVQRLSAEKEQLEAELKLKMDQELLLVRDESQQQLAQMKLQHTESQHRLLHQLHRQRGFWEQQVIQSEEQHQEKVRHLEEQHQEEVQHLEEQHQEEVQHLEEQHQEEVQHLEEQHQEEVQHLEEQHQEEVQHLEKQHQEKVQHLEKQHQEEVQHLEEQRSRAEEAGRSELEACWGRSSELEARLEEVCTQLQESIGFLESHEVLNRRLAAEKSSVEERLTELQVESETCRSLREQELENLQEVLRTRTQSVSRLSAELDSLRTDRARLIQDLKDQAMAVDDLQLQLDGRRSSEEALQEALRLERTRISQLQSGLDEEKEEVCRLSQENRSYIRLADQLSTQIVEMEEEISTLRDHLRELSQQLNDTADLVLDLRTQLNSRTSEATEQQKRTGESRSEVQQLNAQLEAELDRVKKEVLQLQRAQQDSQKQQEARQDSQKQQEARQDSQKQQEDFEEEKRRLTQQLMELEQLVLALEEASDPSGPLRTQLEEVRSENGAQQERLKVLQQEVQTLEDDVSKKRRRLEEMEKEHDRSREEEERLHKENSRYRQEVLDLSSRNLQLSNDNAELSARLRGDQESVRMLRERLATVSKQQEEEEATVRRLQDAALQQERETLQQQNIWTQEKQLLQKELSCCKEKLSRQADVEAELSSANLKLQWLEEDKDKLLRDAEDRNTKVEKLQQRLLSLESEAELLRSQLLSVSQDGRGHAHEAGELHRKLQEAQSKVEELEGGVRRLLREKEELHQDVEQLRVQNQELQNQMSELQVQDLQVQKLNQEQQNLRSRLSEAEEQAVRADASLSLMQAQHMRQLQQLQERTDGGRMERLEELQEKLEEEQRRSQQLEEALKMQLQQSSSQISMKQDQHEKVTVALQQKVQDLEVKLKGVRLVLQEKVQQLKDQMVKSSKASMLLKDVYVENSQLMKALQVTEQRQKQAEKKNLLLEEKVGALNKLMREIVSASLAT
ncbi:ninein-like protein isoform X42 [Acanthochromis polyacanthus]|uniref:ninein-like protein isoform X37 n=1 Tax=Acanthochromis polyacanthus TaxID=80966 RepID=UPI0022348D25|nr:ninein-like protein isoform X37 [Acanthochromis polyacanthus]XP_051815986.1 ninein-like protein isoform X39 [Acanthochromis polyacanthus]XP_051815989.1 ninein-like protein isoform X42 [Acanthochromis polyacanthus]